MNGSRLVPLGEIASIERDGVDPRKVNPNTRYVGLEHIGNDGSIVASPAAGDADLLSTKFQFGEHHILFGKLRPYLRKIARPNFVGVCSTDIIPIAPSKHIDRDYLFHFLRTDAVVARASTMATGANLPRLSPKVLATFAVPLLPLDEQRRIAAILDQTDTLRRKQAESLFEVGKLPQTVFSHMFGDPTTNERKWKRVPLHEILSGIDGGWSPNCLDRPATESEWGVLKLSAITSGTFDECEQKALPNSESPRPNLEIKAGDVLFSRKNTRDLVGACAFVKSVRSRLLLPDLIFRLRLRPESSPLPEYLWQLLMYPTKRASIQALAGGSAGSMPNISKGRLAGVEVEIPPLDLQREFVARLGRVFDVRDLFVDSDVRLKELSRSLQNRFFQPRRPSADQRLEVAAE